MLTQSKAVIIFYIQILIIIWIEKINIQTWAPQLQSIARNYNCKWQKSIFLNIQKKKTSTNDIFTISKGVNSCWRYEKLPHSLLVFILAICNGLAFMISKWVQILSFLCNIIENCLWCSEWCQLRWAQWSWWIVIFVLKDNLNDNTNQRKHS